MTSCPHISFYVSSVVGGSSSVTLGRTRMGVTEIFVQIALTHNNNK